IDFTTGYSPNVTPDVQCEAETSGRRCQLYAGHGPQHASTTAVDGHRRLVRWFTGDAPTMTPVDPGTALPLPWAPGFPQLDPAPVPAVVAGGPKPAGNRATGPSVTKPRRFRVVA
ncbi:MAG: hypothetical protein M3O28_12565, partial [Actinomycetota bacterium]|nr:hypothetical protein [Actinomycetota bacterium]